MSDYLNWEKISEEYFKKKVTQKNDFLQFIQEKEIKNFQEFNQSEFKTKSYRDFVGIELLIKKDLSKYLINHSPKVESYNQYVQPVNQPAINVLKVNNQPQIHQEDPYKSNFSVQEGQKQKDQSVQQILHTQNTTNSQTFFQEETKSQGATRGQSFYRNQKNTQPQLLPENDAASLTQSECQTNINKQENLPQQTQQTRNRRRQNNLALIDSDEEVKVSQNQDFAQLAVRNNQNQVQRNYQQPRNAILQDQELRDRDVLGTNILLQELNQTAISNQTDHYHQNTEDCKDQQQKEQVYTESNHRTRTLPTQEAPSTNVSHYNFKKDLQDNELKEQKEFLLQIQNEQQILNDALSYLKVDKKEMYEYICKDAEIFAQQELFIETKKYINTFKDVKSYKSICEQKMRDTYRLNEHIGYSLYLQYQETMHFKDPSSKVFQKYGLQIEQLQSILKENPRYNKVINDIIDELNLEKLESSVFDFWNRERNLLVKCQNTD
eukprot:403369803